MKTKTGSIGLIVSLGIVLLPFSGCQTASEHRTGTGALTGAALGGGAGALIDDDNPFRGALIGAVAGGAIGAGVGHMLKRQKEAFEQIDDLEVQQETVIIQQPPVVQEGATQAPEPVQTRAEAVLVRVPSDILFDKGSAALSPHGRTKVQELAQVLRDYPDSITYIRGYTSSEGDLQYNIQLSKQRADVVRSELILAGVSPSRLFADGMGPQNPIASNDTESGRAQNRRVELHVIPQS
jgi:outer membrane protein OmpA-like peptidoglycan-associated protein